ncbi:MAG: UvrD-helicase domain-containing protein [Planctomycetes bacterium]|nr:UvrD-helicase domain-containing protein [Planctomycetota bacterium]
MAIADPFLSALNPAQREAVTCTEGPLLVLAGAGTGKTRVITYRIANLLRRGVAPASVLAVTFTNKAAREMRERVAALVGSRPLGMTISTFHSLGVRILRAEAERAGYRHGFNICDENDQVSLLRTVLREIRGAVAGLDPRAVLAAISRAKNRFDLPADVLEAASDDWEHLVAAGYERYQTSLRDMNCVDFDDLILLPVLCLRKDEATSRRYRTRFRHILVDEYQDTNGAQYQFLRCLVGPERNICVVGDDDQSIYGFRGAEVDKILGFERDFPGARIVKLEENYRSTASILDLANAVIAGNPSRHHKVLRSTLGRGEKVRCVAVPDEHAEVEYVLRDVTRLLDSSRVSPRSIAILLRAAAQARPFEEKLRLRRIPYTLIGGQSYFDRKEVRDVLAYWKVAANPTEDISFLRIINVPKRGIGSTAIRKLDDLAREAKVPLLEAVGLAAGGAGDFPPALRAAAGHIRDLFERARERLAAGKPARMARALIDEACYREAVDLLYPDPLTRDGRWRTVEDLVASVERWAEENRGGDLVEFLEALALDEMPREDREDGKANDAERRGVLLMTLHSAKGLEFPHVFLVGVEEGTLPHKKAAEDGDAAIEEERRLLYVGITRARESLTITHAAARTLYGEARPRQLSRFVQEVARQDLLLEEAFRPADAATEADVAELLSTYRKSRGR